MEARDVAGYIIDRFKAIDEELSNLKLQKLLYFAFRNYYKESKEVGKALFKDRFEAWDYGPVIRDIYLDYQKFGARNIEKKLPHKTIQMDKKGMVKFVDIYPNTDNIENNKVAKRVIDDVIMKYMKTDVWDLVNESHEDLSWKKAYVKYCKNIIDNKLIFESSLER
jgi:uncharacterized phage-associated protein